ncbi:MAG: hypothetical protein K2N87_20210 [Eubacterium sp.]|nr:hypothetical protein [Eubacterium sp.]
MSYLKKIETGVRQIGNPCCYRHGDYVVKVSFADTDVTLEDRIKDSVLSGW